MREAVPLNELTIRPTSKFLKAGTFTLLAAVLGANIAWWTIPPTKESWWPPLALLALLLWPAARWVRRRFTKAVISGDRLRFETGMASKSTRTIQLSKIQDVRVDQSLFQRLFGVGDISIETAGETSRLTIMDVDDPQRIADDVMNASHGGAATA